MKGTTYEVRLLGGLVGAIPPATRHADVQRKDYFAGRDQRSCDRCEGR